MCLKDMPSVVARGCPCVDEPATDLVTDLVLDGVAGAAHDRIEAAYAIVELGERVSGKKGTELASLLADEEDLDGVVEETEQYHQVPRSPECLRPLPPTKTVHVRGAVMPTRTVGTPVKKLTQKRHHNNDYDDGDDDEAVSGGGIKAKLARMLIQRKFSNEGLAERSNQNVGVDICRTENVVDANDSDEEGPKGRFVRTAAPVVRRPVSVISHTLPASAVSPESALEYLELKTEQSVSIEEINRFRSSLQERLVNEQVTSLDDSHYRSLSQELSSRQKVSNSKSNAALKDHEICSSEDSSKDVTASSSLYCPSEHVLTSGKDLTTIKSEAESPLARHCFLPRSANYSNYMAGISGLLQYYMLPVMKSSLNSVNSEFGGVQPAAVRSNVDALKQLEQLSRNRGFCSGPAPKGDPVPEAQKSSWNVDGYSQLYGALNGFRGQHHGLSNSSASEATYPLSCLVESLSLQNLSTIERDSPKFSKSRKQHQYVNSNAMAYKSKKLTAAKDGQGSCTVQKFESKVANPRRKPLAVLQAQEMVNRGQFGSLATIRNLYNGMKSRNVDLSACIHQNTQNGKLPTKTGRRPLAGFEEQEQVIPLDLSSYDRRMSHCPAKLKVKEESCLTYPPSVQTPAELCIKENLKATVENCAKKFDVLPPVKPEAAVRSGLDSTSTRLAVTGDGDKCLNGSSTHSVPNSHLPPKKRKFRQTSQNCDFSESKTSPGVKSALTHQVTSHEQKSSQTPVKSHSDQTLETVQGRKSSESDTKVLPDVTADEENILSAVTIQDEDGDLPLHIAVAQGSVDIVQKLLPAMSKVGVSVNSCNNNRQTALHLAVISNQVQMVDLLLKASASANVCDRKGNTVVHLATKYKALPCLKKILQSSRIPLNLDARNYEGLTALHIGVQLSEPDAVRALLIGGANPNTMDGTNGRTPLFNAVEANDFTIASTLVQHGSDPFMANYSGCTPLQIAAGKSLREMIGVLEKSGKEWPRRIQECI